MKIKCPFWDGCYTELEPAELFTHLKTEHHAGEITHKLWETWTKIHEKIKGHEERTPHKVDLNFDHYHFEDPNDFPKICFVCLYGQEMVAELKSLVDEK